MLTRLKIIGFKNLVDVDISFGPFTCIAGPNGSGKSNLFDAITFLSELANDTLLNAASHVRDEKGRTGSIRNIFHRVGDYYTDTVSFEAEMIIPKEGVDDLGQSAIAKITFLTYRISLSYKEAEDKFFPGCLEILEEELRHINIRDASRKIKFNKTSKWQKSVIQGRRTAPFISTDTVDAVSGKKIIKLHQETRQGEKKYGGGKPREFLASTLPRTVLSNVNATESPTALLARREMQSWKLLQLEPSALREPDNYNSPTSLDYKGSHLPATLYHLFRSGEIACNNSVYEQVTFSLGQLLDDVHSIRVDPDSKRELYTLEVSDRNDTYYPARSLSDGTLRFLALAIIKVDPKAIGLICLEEPENGIHPERIPAMIQILRGIAVDSTEPIGKDNPLRQVIINTHSPCVVSNVPDDSLLVVQPETFKRNDKSFKAATFKWLKGTWRSRNKPEVEPIIPGKLMAYLDPVSAIDNKYPVSHKASKRIADLPEFQLKFPEDLR